MQASSCSTECWRSSRVAIRDQSGLPSLSWGTIFVGLARKRQQKCDPRAMYSESPGSDLRMVNPALVKADGPRGVHAHVTVPDESCTRYALWCAATSHLHVKAERVASPEHSLSHHIWKAPQEPLEPKSQ